MDIDSLSQVQKSALDQLQALTNGGDPDVAIGVLSSVDWDVQRAADVIFDNGAPAPPPRPPMSSFQVDDSEQGLLRERPSGREFRRVTPPSTTSAIILRPIRAIISILALPLQLLSSLLRLLFRALHIPLPNVSSLSFSSLNFYRRLGDGRATDARSAAERWVRELEEETGAVCVGSKNRRRAEAEADNVEQSVASGVAGPSTLTARTSAWGGEDGAEGEVKLLPNFFIGGYEEFARTCLKEMKIGCVVLVSAEHDDVAEFKRSTLTDPAFNKLIQENDILVWGGDIRDREAWSASQKLHATTYPFVAFIAIQPRRAPSSASSHSAPSPTLTILSRHQGPSIPSTSGPTSAATLTGHLTTTLLPRLTPFLVRARAQAEEKAREKAQEASLRERERALRAEQDRAFEESRRRDKERVDKRREEERQAAVEGQRQAEAEERARAEKERAEAERRAWEVRRMEWRRWGRRGLMLREPRPGETGRGKTLRVGVRMPDGRRLVRFFGEGDSLTALYAYVDSLFIPQEFGQDADPLSPPEGVAGEQGLAAAMAKEGKTAEEWWGFRLSLLYPRKDISWEPEKKIGAVDALKGGGQLVVEVLADSSKGKGKSTSKTSSEEGAGDSDGYETESD